MKKLVLLCAAAASALLAMNATATLPKGFESVNIHTTLTSFNDDNAPVQVSFGNKDVLNLIHLEFDETIPTGAQLVKYGVGSEDFAVLYANGDYFIDNASSYSGDYELYFYPEGDDYDVATYVKGTKDTYTYEDGEGYFKYVSGNGESEIYMTGLTKWTSNYENRDDSFNLSNGSGYFYSLPGVGGEDYGTIAGSVSGAGTDVEDEW